MDEFSLYDYFFKVDEDGLTEDERDRQAKIEREDRQAELDARAPFEE